MYAGFARIAFLELSAAMLPHDQKRDVVDQASAFGLKLGLRVGWSVTSCRG